MYLHSVFNKSAYRSLIYIDIILSSKLFLILNSFSSRIFGYPANETGYPAGYQI